MPTATSVQIRRPFKLPQLIIENPFPKLQVPEKMIWTASSVALFRACKRKWFWKYLMRLRTRYKDKHLLIGGQFHNCLGHWYKGRKASMRKIVRQYVAELEQELSRAAAFYNQDDMDKLRVMCDSFAGMMIGYQQLYQEDKDNWNIARPYIEKSFQVDLGDFFYAGKIDLIAEDDEGWFQVEHKTASKIEDSYVERLPLDTQIRGYIFGAKHTFPHKINRVLYDVVGKCKYRRKSNETLQEFTDRIVDAYLSDQARYFYREPLRFSKADIECFLHEVHQTHREYAVIAELKQGRAAAPIKEIAKRCGVELPNPMDPRSWVPNDKNCNAYFRTCEYFPLCVRGLDKGTGALYEQGEDLHEELADED